LRSLWRLPAGLAVATLAGVLAAAAASLGGVGVNQFGAGAAVVASCDDDGVALDWVIVFDDESGAYVVTDVDVSGIHGACGGAELSVVLAGAGERLAAGGPVTVADGESSERVALDAPAPAADVDMATVLLSGP
jgi:hypothetical protein